MCLGTSVARDAAPVSIHLLSLSKKKLIQDGVASRKFTTARVLQRITNARPKGVLPSGLRLSGAVTMHIICAEFEEEDVGTRMSYCSKKKILPAVVASCVSISFGDFCFSYTRKIVI
jgi:hypothetical protein